MSLEQPPAPVPQPPLQLPEQLASQLPVTQEEQSLGTSALASCIIPEAWTVPTSDDLKKRFPIITNKASGRARSRRKNILKNLALCEICFVILVLYPYYTKTTKSYPPMATA